MGQHRLLEDGESVQVVYLLINLRKRIVNLSHANVGTRQLSKYFLHLGDIILNSDIHVCNFRMFKVFQLSLDRFNLGLTFLHLLMHF